MIGVNGARMNLTGTGFKFSKKLMWYRTLSRWRSYMVIHWGVNHLWEKILM